MGIFDELNKPAQTYKKGDTLERLNKGDEWGRRDGGPWKVFMVESIIHINRSRFAREYEFLEHRFPPLGDLVGGCLITKKST